MRAVADNVAFSTQYGGLQRNRIQRSARRKQAINVRLVHHSPLGRGSSFQPFCHRLPTCGNGSSGSFLYVLRTRLSDPSTVFPTHRLNDLGGGVLSEIAVFVNCLTLNPEGQMMNDRRRDPWISCSYEFYPKSSIVEPSESEFPVSSSDPRVPGGDYVLLRRDVGNDACNTRHVGMAALAGKYSPGIHAPVPSPQNLADSNRSGPGYVCVLRSAPRHIDSFHHFLSAV